MVRRYRIAAILLCAGVCGIILACGEPNDIGVGEEPNDIGVGIDDDVEYIIRTSFIAEGKTGVITFVRSKIPNRATTIVYDIDGGHGHILNQRKEIFTKSEMSTDISLYVPFDDNEVDEVITVILKEVANGKETEVKRAEFIIYDANIKYEVEYDAEDCRADVYTDCKMVRGVNSDGKIEYTVVHRDGVLENFRDQDWFEVNIANGLRYQIAVEDPVSQGLSENIEAALVNSRTDEEMVPIAEETDKVVFYTSGNNTTYWLQVGVKNGATNIGRYAVTITQIDQCTDNFSSIVYYHSIRSDNYIENSVRDGLCEVVVGKRAEWHAIDRPENFNAGDINLHYIYLESDTRYTFEIGLHNTDSPRAVVVQLFSPDKTLVPHTLTQGRSSTLVRHEYISGSGGTFVYQTNSISEKEAPFVIGVKMGKRQGFSGDGDYSILVTDNKE